MSDARLLDIALFAAQAVRSHRLRSALSILGIAIGIAAVVALTSVGEGVRRFVLAEFTQFGTHLLAVVPGRTTTFGISGATIATVRPLTVDDALALARLRHVRGVVPMVQGNAQVRWRGRARRTTVFGVGPQLPEVWSMAVASGRFLSPDALRSPRPEVVLGARVREELYGATNPLGRRLQVGNERYRVVGVMAPKGQMLGFDLDDTVYIPVGRALAMFDREGVMEIDVLYAPVTTAEHISAAVRRLLVDRHGREDFTIITQDRMLEVLGSVLDVLTLGVAAIGAISLLVGAVGVLTIMTIAVAERTAEIGLLRALGARRRDVLRLFLVESVVLALSGAVAGVATIALLVTAVRALVPALPVALAPAYVAAALAAGLVIGLASGIAPALRAARLDPLQALRAE